MPLSQTPVGSCAIRCWTARRTWCSTAPKRTRWPKSYGAGTSSRQNGQALFTASKLEQALGLLGARNRKGGGVEEAQLDEQRGLIPVDVFVGDLVALEPHHDDRGDARPSSCRGDPGQHERDLGVVRELEDELVDPPIRCARPGDRT